MNNTVEMSEGKGDFKEPSGVDPSLSVEANLVGDIKMSQTDKSILWYGQDTWREVQTSQFINFEREGWKLVKRPDKEQALKEFKLQVESNTCEPHKLGRFGETILHYALLHKNEEISEYLIKLPELGRTLRKAVYGPPKNKADYVESNVDEYHQYKGEGCLHLAIANRSKKMVTLLLDEEKAWGKPMKKHQSCDFNSKYPKDYSYPLNTQRAIGTFFQGKGPDTVYWGETALDFAVSTNQLGMVDILLGYTEEKKDVEIECPFDWSDGLVKKKFNRKWRASLKLKDMMFNNTVFHLCALRGHTDMWHHLSKHLETTIRGETKSTDVVEFELEAEKWVRSQVNIYGFTPLQLAAYANEIKMVETIVMQTRIRIWKYGDQAYNAYTLNEIDDYFKDSETTPGIPITNIILSQGHFELLSLQVISKLLEDKWSSFGWKWTCVFFIVQLAFVVSLTVLFLGCHPDLNDFDDSNWGVKDNWVRACYFIVFFKVCLEIVTMVIEIRILYNNNKERKKYIREQVKKGRELIKNAEQFYNNTEQINNRIISISNVSDEMTRSDDNKRCFSCRWMISCRWMMSFYFETPLKVPDIFHKGLTLKRDHRSVAEFFLWNGLVSNITFIIAQSFVFDSTRTKNRCLIYLMIFILLIEYLQLFLWLQTNSHVGRFISAMVHILNKDVVGFMVVILVMLLAFSACFMVLMENQYNMEQWSAMFWIVYELSAGTGEFFKDKMDSIFLENDGSKNDNIDPYLKFIIFLTYVAYITFMLVVVLNLLIAVMSETTGKISSEMQFREKRLKLSSISIITRRLKALSVITRKKCEINTIGGMTVSEFKLRKHEHFSPALKEYYEKLYYCCALEEESIEIDKDGKVETKNVEQKLKEDERSLMARNSKRGDDLSEIKETLISGIHAKEKSKDDEILDILRSLQARNSKRGQDL